MNADKVYQMNWSVYFILAVSIASIAWGVVNYFFIQAIEYKEAELIPLLREDAKDDVESSKDSEL
jgi:hypothetical protein